MKQANISTAIILITLLTSNVFAADVTEDFNTGDTLTATKINNIKDAVNSKQNRVSGSCSAGESIRTIEASGAVICEADNDTLPPVNSVTTGNGLTNDGNAADPVLRPVDSGSTISWLSLRTTTSGCIVDYNSDYAAPSASGSGGCFFQAPVQVPVGATLTSLICNASVDVTKAGLSFQLQRIFIDGTAQDLLFQVGLSGQGVGTRETVVSTTPFGNTQVLNNSYLYYIDTSFMAISVDPGEFRFYGCRVGYTY
ncbi:MAG: hypothetical protein AAF353_02370 [Pseudomonadota bacterium]